MKIPQYRHCEYFIAMIELPKTEKSVRWFEKNELTPGDLLIVRTKTGGIYEFIGYTEQDAYALGADEVCLLESIPLESL